MNPSFLHLASFAADSAQQAKEIGQIFGFNWHLFLSQIVSFSIVALMLQKFAFKPIIAVLEERREKIAESLRNAEKIKEELAGAEVKSREIIAKADAEAKNIIAESRKTADAVAEKREQQAVLEAERILTNAREASAAEREKVMAGLRREFGRLVIDTTAKVTGKVLSAEDQKRLNEEAARQAAA